MKKIATLLFTVLAAGLCLAACKANNGSQAETSQGSAAMSSAIEASEKSERSDESSREEEAKNGKITDDNGIIGDGDNKDNTLSDITHDAASGAQSIVDNAGEGLQSAGEDLKNAAGNAAEGIRDGISDAVTDDDDHDHDYSEESLDESETSTDSSADNAQ